MAQQTVESRFYEPRRETKVGSKNRRVREIGGKIKLTVFEKQLLVRVLYREVRKTEGSRSRDSTAILIVTKHYTKS